MKGKTKCRVHGGKSLAGVASPTFKTGRYSKYMPAPLAAKCREMLADPEWMSLNAEIATARARIAELMASLPADGPGEALKRMVGLRLEILEAGVKGDTQAAGTRMNELLNIIGQIGFGINTWDDINRATEQLRRLVESQAKVSLAAGYLWEVADVMRMYQQLMQAIHENVPDQKARAAIQARADELGFTR